MDLTYIIIAAVIIILPFALSRLFSGSTRDAKTVLGASTPAPRITPVSAGGDVLSEEVKALLAHGRKIEAIKVVRERTGFPLEAAKDMVEMIGKTGTAQEVAQTLERATSTAPVERTITDMLRLARELTPEVQRLIKENRKVDAIKLIHDRTGMGLKEAKTIVDRLGG
jgi:ribosomal protein L7/L12